MVLTLSHYARYCSAQVLYSDSPSSPMTSRLYSSEYTCSNVGGGVLSSAVSCTAPTSMWCALLPAAGFRDPVARLPPDQMEPPSFSRGGDGCTPNTHDTAERTKPRLSKAKLNNSTTHRVHAREHIIRKRQNSQVSENKQRFSR